MYRYAIIMLAIFLSACAANQPGKRDLISAFKPTIISKHYLHPFKSGSILHPNPELVRDEIMEMTGCLFAIVGEGKDQVIHQLKQMIENDHRPTLLTKDNDILFEGIVDKNTKTDLRILLTTISHLTEEKLHITYETIAKTKLTDKAIPWKTLEDKANKQPQKDITLYYARSIMLNRLAERKYFKVSNDQRIAGTGFAAGGRIYHSTQEQRFSYEVILNGFPISMLSDSKTSELRKSLDIKTDAEVYRVASRPDLLKLTSPALLKPYENLPYELKALVRVGTEGTRISSSPEVRPVWTYLVPKSEGFFYTRGASGAYPSEELARSVALQNAKKETICNLWDMASFGGYESADPLWNYPMSEKSLEYFVPNIDRHLRAKDYYVERWMMASGVAWKAFVLVEMPRETVDELLKNLK